jgi:hypothetical protein
MTMGRPGTRITGLGCTAFVAATVKTMGRNGVAVGAAVEPCVEPHQRQPASDLRVQENNVNKKSGKHFLPDSLQKQPLHHPCRHQSVDPIPERSDILAAAAIGRRFRISRHGQVIHPVSDRVSEPVQLRNNFEKFGGCKITSHVALPSPRGARSRSSAADQRSRVADRVWP